MSRHLYKCKCGYCGYYFTTEHKNAHYCSREHSNLAKKAPIKRKNPEVRQLAFGVVSAKAMEAWLKR